MRRAALLLALIAVPFVIAPHAVGRLAAVAATGKITNGSQPNSYVLTIVNTGDQPLECVQFFVPQGVTLSSVQQPSNAHLGFGATSFGGGFVPPLAPGGSASVAFTTTDAYPASGIGLLHVSADCRADVVVTVPGPQPIPTTPPPTTTPNPTKCKCGKLAVTLDGTLLNKKGLAPDKHDFGVGFAWRMTCTKGTGGCTGSLTFSPPVILAGTLPKPPNNLHLNLKVMTFTCASACKTSTTGKFQVKMTSRDQLNKLFGRTLAYTIKSRCSGVTKTQKVTVFVDQHGVLRLHP